MTVLELDKVSIRFGGLVAVSQVSFNIHAGEILALIGPNGAGKTTIFNLIMGLYKLTDGKILFKNINISSRKPHQIAALGIGRTFQTIHLFNQLTVFDNVLIGAHTQGGRNMTGALLKWLPAIAKEEKDLHELAFRCLQMVGLEKKRDALAKNLPYGEQRRLEIARALALKPSLLLLDEPAAGMNPQETKELMELIHVIRNSGITILLVEHDMKFVMKISDRIVVLDYGAKIAEGVPEEIRTSPLVIQAYLGKVGAR